MIFIQISPSREIKNALTRFRRVPQTRKRFRESVRISLQKEAFKEAFDQLHPNDKKSDNSKNLQRINVDVEFVENVEFTILRQLQQIQHFQHQHC
jgi:phenylalanyl-tRNA synthetase alpha subunit